MAYNSVRERDPLIDKETQRALERRLTELLGIVLIGCAILFSLIIFSYSAADPGPLSASDLPVQNWLGNTGAAIASPLILVIGWGSWSLAPILLIWGLRFLFHVGSERAFGRLIFMPIAIALSSVYAASIVPIKAWAHTFGMGGLFGDTIVGSLLSIIPLSSPGGILAITVTFLFLTIILNIFCSGFIGPEIKKIVEFLFSSSKITFSLLSIIFAKVVSYVVRKTHSKTGQIGLGGNVADPYEGSFVPRAPGFNQFNSPNLYNDGSDLNASSVAPRIFKQEGNYHEEVGSGDIFSNPRLSSKISAAISSRFQVDQEDLLQKTETDDVSTSSNTFIGEKNDSDFVEPGSRIEPPITTFNSENLYDDDYDQASFAEIAEDEFSNDFYENDPKQLIPSANHKKVVQTPPRKIFAKSARAKNEAQPGLDFDGISQEFELPPLSLLTNPTNIQRHTLSDEALEENARLLESVLDDYGVKGEIVSVRPGPVVTMYELEPAPGLKASRVIGLADDIARSMSALSTRVSTVPGRSVIGIELPNENREKVVLREILSSRYFGDGKQQLPLALGKDIGGEPIVANLAKMPHLLIAGTTGSGKSVAINTMILSLLYKLTPEECRLIMIDPKMLELSVYDGIPHLLSPVVTDPKKAVVALKWVVGEMEERYRKMSKMGVRNIDGFNSRVFEAKKKDEMFSRTIQTGFDDQTGDPVFETEEFKPEKMPYIVVIVDEMADLMMVAGKEIEACIQRLAQMARASGIHLIMATQRPSVDVITGTIKANFPTRISFQVTSKIDSRTILGEMGAEQLLGMGDMLYMAGGSKITRCHGPFVSDEEVEEIVNHLKAFGPPEYKSGVVDGPTDDKVDGIDQVLGLGGNTDGEDAIYDQAVAIVVNDRKCSTSYIQRKLAIGYNKAARIVEQMEDQGLVSPANHVGKREILIPE
ncbi:MAG: DNA translocase FtsK 4TM domain-containing protein [Rhodobacteraceae bacterium]|nr:DNA translocase FtsK 4TM domain-containing protein [Paracoccaceae bacterium]